MHKGNRLIQGTSRGAGSIGRHGVKDRVVDVEPVARGYVAGDYHPGGAPSPASSQMDGPAVSALRG